MATVCRTVVPCSHFHSDVSISDSYKMWSGRLYYVLVRVHVTGFSTCDTDAVSDPKMVHGLLHAVLQPNESRSREAVSTLSVLLLSAAKFCESVNEFVARQFVGAFQVTRSQGSSCTTLQLCQTRTAYVRIPGRRKVCIAVLRNVVDARHTVDCESIPVTAQLFIDEKRRRWRVHR